MPIIKHKHWNYNNAKGIVGTHFFLQKTWLICISFSSFRLQPPPFSLKYGGDKARTVPFPQATRHHQLWTQHREPPSRTPARRRLGKAAAEPPLTESAPQYSTLPRRKNGYGCCSSAIKGRIYQKLTPKFVLAHGGCCSRMQLSPH